MPSQRRYICSFCARAFSRSEHKSRHERSHTKEKPYHCDQCTSCFVRRDLLQRHLRTVHSKEKKLVRSVSEVVKNVDSGAPKVEVVEKVEKTKVDSQGIINNKDLFIYSNDSILTILTISKKLNSKLILNWAIYQNSQLPIIKFDQLKSLTTDSPLFEMLEITTLMELEPLEAKARLSKVWNLIVQLSPQDSITCLTMIADLCLKHYDELTEIIPIELIMQNLDEKICFLISKNVILFNYWEVYNILSNYCFQFNKKIPNLHELILFKFLPINNMANVNNLYDLISSFTKSNFIIEHQDFETLKKILINCFKLEIQCLKMNKKSILPNKEILHNSIILFIKQYNKLKTSNDSQIDDFLKISKQYLLLNCPLKFQDLIVEYLNFPLESQDWDVLYLSLKEYNFKFNHISIDNVLDSHDQIESMNNYINSLNLDEINNNLGIFGLPIMFLGFIKEYKPKDYKFLNSIIIETFCILLKVFNNYEKLENNPIVQSLVYLINEMSNDGQDLISKIFENFNNWLVKLDIKLDLHKLQQRYMDKSPIIPTPTVDIPVLQIPNFINDDSKPRYVNDYSNYPKPKFEYNNGRIQLPPLNIGGFRPRLNSLGNL